MDRATCTAPIHALPDLRNPAGEPDRRRARFGGHAARSCAEGRETAAHAACVFDAKGKTFRDDWYPEYKAQPQRRCPKTLVHGRSSPSTRWCACWAGRCWKCPASKPTTSIGTLAQGRRRIAASRSLISTGDKDLAQLVERARHAHQHDEQRASRHRRASSKQVRCAARAHRRLPDAGGRHGRQRAWRRQGRPEDGGEAGWPNTARCDGVVDAAADRIKGAVGENLQAARLTGCRWRRKLVTVQDRIAIWPTSRARLAQRRRLGRPGLARGRPREALLDFYARYGFNDLAARDGSREIGRVFRRACDAQVDLRRHRPASAVNRTLFGSDAHQTPVAGWQRHCCRPAGRSRRSALRDGADAGKRFEAWIAKIAGVSRAERWWPRSTPRPIRSTRLQRATSSASELCSVTALARPAYIPLGHDLPRRARAAARWTRCWRALKPWLEDAGCAEAGPEHQVRPARHVLQTTGISHARLPARHDAAELRARSAQAAQPGKPGAAATSNAVA